MKIKNQTKQYEGSRSVKPYLALNSLHKLPDGNRLTNFLYSPNGEKKKRAMVRECISKRRFATLKDAERVAGRFGQRVVKCRHCSGGFHCTSKKELKTKVTGPLFSNRLLFLLNHHFVLSAPLAPVIHWTLLLTIDDLSIPRMLASISSISFSKLAKSTIAPSISNDQDNLLVEVVGVAGAVVGSGLIII